MEPIELSVEEQIDLFHSLAAQRGMLETKLWHKGLSLCLEQDKENKVTLEKPSQVRRYLRETIRSDTSKVVGLNVEFIALGINQAKQQGILNDADATKMYADIIFSGALIDKEEQRILLSKPEVRAELHEHLDEIHLRSGSQDRDSKEGRVAYLLEMYERELIIRDTGSKRDVKFDQEVRKAFGKEKGNRVLAGIDEGISPHKKLRRKLPVGKKYSPISNLIRDIRKKTKDKGVDRLKERQKVMEERDKAKKSFVGLIEQERQND